MADPISLQILKALEIRCQSILISNGFNTDAGNQVYLGKRQVNPDEVESGPVLLLFDESDEIDTEQVTTCIKYVVAMDVTIQVHMEYDANDHTELLHKLVQDIKKAIFNAINPLDGMPSNCLSIMPGNRRVIYPSNGGDVLAARQGVQIQYVEDYGNP